MERRGKAESMPWEHGGGLFASLGHEGGNTGHEGGNTGPEEHRRGEIRPPGARTRGNPASTGADEAATAPWGADEALRPTGMRTRSCVASLRLRGVIFVFDARVGLDLLFRTPTVLFVLKTLKVVCFSSMMHGHDCK